MHVTPLGMFMEVKLVHPSNAPPFANAPTESDSILFKLFGRIIEVNRLMSLHKASGITSTLSPKMKDVTFVEENTPPKPPLILHVFAFHTTEVILVHSLNVILLIAFTFSPIVTEAKFVLALKTWSPNAVTLLGMIMELRLHHEKAPVPMLLTLFPIVAEVRLLHLENEFSPIFVTLLGISMVVRPVHQANALFPILVTLLGILTEVKPVQ